MKKLLIILALLLPAATQADWYLVIPAEFAQQYNLVYCNPPNNCFGARQDVNGRWVCALKSKEDFEEIFIDVQCDTVELTPADFPQPAEDSTGN